MVLTVAVEQLQPVVDAVVGLLSVVLLSHRHRRHHLFRLFKQNQLST